MTEDNGTIRAAWCNHNIAHVVHVAAEDETSRFPILCKNGPALRNTTFGDRPLIDITCDRCLVHLERLDRKALRDARRKVDEAVRIERINALVGSNRARLGPRMTQ